MIIELSGGRKALVEYDCYYEPPFSGDDDVKIVILHKRYKDPSEGFFGDDIDKDDPEWFKIPLFMYEHSGIILRPGYENPFYCPWDSGRVGIIALKKSSFGGDLFKISEAVAQEYTHYMNGEVYHYVIQDKDGKVLDSCGGFFGMEEVEKAIRVICEELPAHDFDGTPAELETAWEKIHQGIDRIYRLALDALEPKPQPAPAECYRECDDPSCPYMHTPGPTREGLD